MFWKNDCRHLHALIRADGDRVRQAKRQGWCPAFTAQFVRLEACPTAKTNISDSHVKRLILTGSAFLKHVICGQELTQPGLVIVLARLEDEMNTQSNSPPGGENSQNRKRLILITLVVVLLFLMGKRAIEIEYRLRSNQPSLYFVINSGIGMVEQFTSPEGMLVGILVIYLFATREKSKKKD